MGICYLHVCTTCSSGHSCIYARKKDGFMINRLLFVLCKQTQASVCVCVHAGHILVPKCGVCMWMRARVLMWAAMRGV